MLLGAAQIQWLIKAEYIDPAILAQCRTTLQGHFSSRDPHGVGGVSDEAVIASQCLPLPNPASFLTPCTDVDP